jgi:hypothetical protein
MMCSYQSLPLGWRGSDGWLSTMGSTTASDKKMNNIHWRFTEKRGGYELMDPPICGIIPQQLKLCERDSRGVNACL